MGMLPPARVTLIEVMFGRPACTKNWAKPKGTALERHGNQWLQSHPNVQNHYHVEMFVTRAVTEMIIASASSSLALSLALSLSLSLSQSPPK